MTEAAALRQELLLGIADHLRDIQLHAKAIAGYDPGTQTVSEPAEEPHEGRGRIGTYADKLIDGTHIKKQDRVCTFVPNDPEGCPEPKEGDIIAAGTARYHVVASKKREVNDELICHSIQVRTI